MGRKTKLQLEVEAFSRSRNFKSLKAMLNSFDYDDNQLAIAIIESKKRYKRLTHWLKSELASAKINNLKLFEYANNYTCCKIIVDESLYKVSSDTPFGDHFILQIKEYAI